MNKLHIDTRYFQSTDELRYISDSISFIENKISPEIELISKKYDDELAKHEAEFSNSTSEEGSFHSEMEKTFINDYYQSEYYHYDSISKTIIESLFIRQIAIVERFIIETAFDLFKDLLLSRQPLIPPNYIKSNSNTFSDCIAAADSIRINTSINIKEINEWKIFVKSREIRHKLAHGEIKFSLSHVDADYYNSFLPEALISRSSNIIIMPDHEKYSEYKKEWGKQRKNKSDFQIVENDISLSPIAHPFNAFYEISLSYVALKKLNEHLKKLLDGIFEKAQ